MKIMTDYEIIDYMLIDFIESGDMINFASEDYLVISITSVENGWDLIVVDRLEDEIDLFIPDATIVALLGE